VANGKRVALLPVADHVEPECERALIELAKTGWDVRRMAGNSAIDLARSMMATEVLDQGYEDILWVDADIAFTVDSVEKLRGHKLPIACGLYAKKGQRELAAYLLPETKEVVFGEAGGLLEVRYVGAGFVLTRREVYEDIRDKLEIKRVNTRWGAGFYPFFQPLVIEDPAKEGALWYLGEDFAFCERARRAGHTIFADTTVRLLHIGRYGFGWEDAGASHGPGAQRYATYKMSFGEKSKEETKGGDS
jgi:hypothetical protein